MNKATLFFAAAVLAVAVAVAAAPAYAGKGGGGGGGEGSPASNKAYFGTNTVGVMFDKFNATLDCGIEDAEPQFEFDKPNDKLCTSWMEIYYVKYALKTSTNGGVGVYVSLECSLWTDSEAAALIGGSGSGGSRAGVEVRVRIGEAGTEPDDWSLAEPQEVVFCDRLQYIKLKIPALEVAGFGLVTPVVENDPFVVGLFQRTKSANAFNYYLAAPAMEVGVKVEARGIVQCFKDGDVAPCSDSGIDIPKFIDGPDGTIEGGTKAAIGKASFVIEEHNNWDSSTYTPPY